MQILSCRMAEEHFPHDGAYKSFFKNPEMVKSLITDFLPPEIAEGFDFGTLQQCSGAYATPNLHERRDDLVWRARFKGTWCYVYILLEFQSSSDYWMALRILSYTALLWEDLVRTEVVKKGEKLPPVLPIVIYNGAPVWTAPVNVRDLVGEVPAPMEKFLPAQRYFLLDELRISDALLSSATGEASLIFRFENCKTPAEFQAIFRELQVRLWDEKFDALRRSIHQWLYALLERKQFEDEPDNPAFVEDLAMLAQRIRQWEKDFYNEGKAEGIAEGKARGLAEGRSEGEARARAEGIANQHGLLLEMLKQKFGEIPAYWTVVISQITDAASLNNLILAIMRVNTREEFEKQLPN